MKLIVRGVVQGVGFRPTVYRVARQLQLKGYVLNKGSEVEIVIDRDDETFLKMLKDELPPIAKITKIIKKPENVTYTDFQILHSKTGEKESPIPADICTCEQCIHEISDPSNRRYQYPFTNCTVCGARYSLIIDVPYDRERTSMYKFPLCSACNAEYIDPNNRRYHAQTISCPNCGPVYRFYDKNKKDLGTDHAIERFAEQLDKGLIGIIKSWGGMHLCCRTDEIQRFREWYKRPQKPFAVMVRDLTTARLYARTTDDEERFMLSNKRPVVLTKKKAEKQISPGLDTIGLFLPYTGTHHLLFSYLQTDALIMTSANIPGEPMLLHNTDAFNLDADMYLLHNRDIPNRTDDSVIRLYKHHKFFLRKSRGYIPDPIPIPYNTRVLTVGAGENVTGALSTNNFMYSTQYIGDSQYQGALEFLDQSLRHLMTTTMKVQEIDAVGMDLHPQYETRTVAKRFAKEYAAPLIEVQHHWAHAASLLIDNNEEESVILTLDGLGYGDDGTFWGGEILHTRFDSYNRVGHLEPIPLLGGDKATKDPRRLVFAIFHRLGKEHGFTGDEAAILEKMMKKSPQSTSMGRILDALSCYLDICDSRTYDGEPAMKLEKYLAHGEEKHHFTVTQHNGVINTSDLFQQLSELIHPPLLLKEKADFAYSMVRAIIDAMTDIAIQTAEQEDIKTIGVTGGVSYNIPITKMIDNQAKKEGVKLLLHNRIPNGDGGISLGQNAIVAHQLKTKTQVKQQIF